MSRTFRIVVSILLTGLLTLGFLAPTSAEAASKKVSAGSVKITGTAKVGLTLTAKTASWKPSGLTLKYQWYRSGKKIGGATKVTYTLSSADLNKQITVKVTGSKAKYKTTSKTSGKTKKVGLGTMTPGHADILGKLAVGNTVRAMPGAWTPAKVAYKYQWFRDGDAISGATGSTYKITAADLDTILGIDVYGTASGYTKGTSQYDSTALVGPAGTWDGTLEVGVDIPAGDYQATGGAQCLWQRQSGPGQKISDGPVHDGQTIVTVSPSDKYFYSQDCGNWGAITPISPKLTSFGDGDYAIAQQLAPGTYQTITLGDPTYGCYWELARGFGATEAETIDSGLVMDISSANPLTVTIPDDGSAAAFITGGCGTWTRVSG